MLVTLPRQYVLGNLHRSRPIYICFAKHLKRDLSLTNGFAPGAVVYEYAKWAVVRDAKLLTPSSTIT